MQNFLGWKLVFSGISKGKVTNLKIPELIFQESISSTRPVWIFSGVAQWTGEFYAKSQITISGDNFSMAIAIELFQKNSKQEGGLRTWNFLGLYWKNIMWKFQGSIKKELEFPGVIKAVLVFGPGSCKGCNTILWNFSRGETSFCLEFPRMKWQNLKNKYIISLFCCIDLN